MIMNVTKHETLIDKNYRAQLKKDIYKIHMSRSKSEYKNLIKEFVKTYKKGHPEMLDYIYKNWFKSVFNRWQIFRNSHGFANTNYNIESFNSTIKRDFTMRKKLPVGLFLRLEK